MAGYVVDWEAVGALGTWVVGLAAVAIAWLTFQRDRDARHAADRDRALIAATHLTDLERDLELRLHQLMAINEHLHVAARASEVEYYGLHQAIQQLHGLSFSKEQREAAAHEFELITGAGQAISELQALGTRGLDTRQDDAGSPLAWVGNFEPLRGATMKAMMTAARAHAAVSTRLTATFQVLSRAQA